MIGMLVDRYGFPLEIGCFEGSKSEKLTLIPMIEQFKNRHGVEGMVIVGDAGMFSGDNLKDLDNAGMKFIVGSRMTKAPIDLESHFRWNGDAFTDGQLIDTITPKTGTRSDNNPLVRREPVWQYQEYPRAWRAVWHYSDKRFRRDNITLNKQEERARAVAAGEKPAKKPRFLITGDNGAVRVNEKTLARARSLAGLKGYVTSVPATMMTASQIVAAYHDLWHVEQTFRMAKTDCNAAPVFVRTLDAIEAHLTLVFTALAVSREVQRLTGRSIADIVWQLQDLRTSTIAINGVEQSFPPQTDPRQQEIIDTLHGQNWKTPH